MGHRPSEFCHGPFLWFSSSLPHGAESNVHVTRVCVCVLLGEAEHGLRHGPNFYLTLHIAPVGQGWSLARPLRPRPRRKELLPRKFDQLPGKGGGRKLA